MPIKTPPSTAQANNYVWHHLVESTTSRSVQWSAIVNGEEGLALQSITAIPVVRPTPSLEHNVRRLTVVRRLTKLILSFDSSSQPTEVFGVLSGFECLEELEITFEDKWSILEVFPRIETLRKVTIKNVTLSRAALNSLVANTNLQSLILQNVQYGRALNALRQLTNLRRLEVSGYVPGLSLDVSFLDSMRDIEEVSLEMENPWKRVLETLNNSPAAISLRLHGCCIDAYSSRLARIPNLINLIFHTRCCLAIPTSFQDLSKLTSVSFVDHAVPRTPMVGPENLPLTTTNLYLDLTSIFLKEDPFPDRLTSTITELVIKLPNIGTKLGLGKFTNLQCLELSAKQELDGEVVQELKQLHSLKELKLGGALNIEKKMLDELAQLPLESMTISNSTIILETPSAIERFLSLKTAAFYCCFFLDCDLDCLAFSNSLENLILDRCTQIEEHLFHVLSAPFIRGLKSVQFGLRNVLSDDQLMQVYAKQQELGLLVSIQYYQSI